jgi:hypothetical protein
MNHPANGRGVFQLNRFIDFGQPHAPQHFAMFLWPADHAFDQGDIQFASHLLYPLLYFLNPHATPMGDLFGALQLLQPLNGCFDDIMRIVGPHDFGQDVLNPHGFKDRPNGATGDNAGTFGSRFEQYTPGTELSDDLKGDRALFEGDLDHTLFRFFNALADGLGDFARFAQSKADAALAVTDHDNGTEAKPTTAFDHFGHTTDVHHFVNQLGFIHILLIQEPASL